MIVRPTQKQKDYLIDNFNELLDLTGLTREEFSNYSGHRPGRIREYSCGGDRGSNLTDSNYILFKYVFTTYANEHPEKKLLNICVKEVFKDEREE